MKRWQLPETARFILAKAWSLSLGMLAGAVVVFGALAGLAEIAAIMLAGIVFFFADAFFMRWAGLEGPRRDECEGCGFQVNAHRCDRCKRTGCAVCIHPISGDEWLCGDCVEEILGDVDRIFEEKGKP